MARCLLAFLLRSGEDGGDPPQLHPSAPALLAAQAHSGVPAASVTLPTAPQFPASASISWYCSSTWDLLNMLLLPINPTMSTWTTRYFSARITCYTSGWHNTALNWILSPKCPGNTLIDHHFSYFKSPCLAFATPSGMSQLACCACWPSPDPHFLLPGSTWRVSTGGITKIKQIHTEKTKNCCEIHN